MSSPPYCPRYTLEYSDMLVSTIAPRTGPRTVPTPPITAVSTIIIETLSVISMDGSMYKMNCAYKLPPILTIAALSI